MKLALAFLLASCAWAQSAQPVKFVTADPSGACSNGTAMRYNYTNGKFWGCQGLVWTLVSSGGGGSPISGATTNAIVTAASATTIQTAVPGATMDSGGNISTPGTITSTASGPGTLRLGTATVSGLPTCSSPANGTRASVTDATATTFLSVVAGGGGNNVPVYCDGSNWRIG